MKHQKIHMPNISYVAAFIIGVIWFALLWKVFFGSAVSLIVLAGTAGVAVSVTFFWIRSEIEHHKREK